MLLLKDSTGIPHFVGLSFIALYRYCIFYKVKICGGPASSKSVDTIFLIAFVYFVSV